MQRQIMRVRFFRTMLGAFARFVCLAAMGLLGIAWVVGSFPVSLCVLGIVGFLCAYVLWADK